MSFQYPLGLLGLIGIPVLILIYIIKSRYTEQTVSSTYLWNLSEKFLKKKKKDRRITGIISLILQILAVAVISITIAHPVFTVSGGAYEYYFVLDSTGSMNIEQEDGKTRFDLAKEKICEIVDDSVDGSVYSLVCVGNEAVTAFEYETDKEKVTNQINKLTPGHGNGDFVSALGKAQAHFELNSSAKVYYVTDKSIGEHNNVELIDVSTSQENYTIFDVTYKHNLNGDLTVKGKVISYESDQKLNLQLFVDGNAVSGNEYKQDINTKKGVAKDFQFDVNVEEYQNVSVKILNSDTMSIDNEVVLYNVKNENSYKTLLVSKTPFFLESVLSVAGNADITVMSPSEYLEKEANSDRSITGYGLYVFHSCNPVAVPKDGSVWLINSSASVANSGFNYQGEILLDKAETIDKTRASASLIKKLLADVDGEEIYISKYSKYETYRSFNTLFTHEGNPVIFTGVNLYGNREVVFAFDLHNSDMPLLADYAILVRNLLNYSFPAIIEDTYYNCGEAAPINSVSNCESIRVESPTGKISHLNTSTAVNELMLDESGVYTIKATVNGEVKEYHIFSAFLKDESDPTVNSKEMFSLNGSASEEGFDGTYSKLIVFFIFLAVVISVDWMVYCYDKYQLR